MVMTTQRAPTVSAAEAPREVRSGPRSGRVAATGDDSPVLITGICGRLGQRLARKLHRERPVIGIDRRDFVGRPKDIAHHRIDIRRKKTQDIFRAERLAAIVHLGIMHDPRASQSDHHTWNVAGFSRVLEYAAQYNVYSGYVMSDVALTSRMRFVAGERIEVAKSPDETGADDDAFALTTLPEGRAVADAGAPARLAAGASMVTFEDARPAAEIAFDDPTLVTTVYRTGDGLAITARSVAR